MTPIPNGFNLERLVVLVRHGARTTLSQAKVLQPQEWIMKNLINTVSIAFRVFCFLRLDEQSTHSYLVVLYFQPSKLELLRNCDIETNI